jgi:hypothetical protein
LLCDDRCDADNDVEGGGGSVDNDDDDDTDGRNLIQKLQSMVRKL